ncbi:MAG TPA: TonB family protein [Candidatus Sulfotelmatobacter sp.]|nr:TonB family protein [Candidatus Sulfotelmatobacter sp.]
MSVRIAAFLVLLAALFAPAIEAQESGTQSVPPAPAQSPAPKPQRIRIGGNVQAAAIIHQVMPVYPKEAKNAGIAGTVVLHAIIGKDGTVRDLMYVSGPPLLMKSALDAVKQWVYKPTLLQGEPVEVDTTISVVYTLGNSPPPADSAAAQAPRSEDDAKRAIDPQLKADILHLVEISRLREREAEVVHSLFESMRPLLLQTIPPTPSREKILDAYGEKLAALLSSDEFTDRVVQVYAKYFIDDDIKAITAFYQTPAGARLLEASPKMALEMMQVGQGLAQEKSDSILKQLCREYPELQGVAKFCPESPMKKSLLLGPAHPPAAQPSGN